MPFYVLAVLLIVLLAGAVVALVAISSGKLKTNRPKLEAFVQRTEEALDGEAEPPHFLERLDEAQERRRSSVG